VTADDDTVELHLRRRRPLVTAAATALAVYSVAMALALTVHHPTADRPADGTTAPPTTPIQLVLPAPATTIVQAATVTEPALRVSPPPVPSTIPIFADDCAEMTWYRIQAGLPAVFDRLGWRESRCQNYVTSPTNCCRGWLQLDIKLHLRDHRLGWRYRDNCGVHSIPDAFGDNPSAKQKHMCAAKQLYDVMGLSPWAL